MKKITIFGDSYGDPNYNKNEVDTAWYEMFEGYEVTNHCLCSTGPHHSMKKYYEFIRNKDKSIVIFLLSGEDRIAFPNTNPQHISHINWDFQSNESWFADNSKLTEEKAYYDSHKFEIDFTFRTMREELLWSNYKNLSMLYLNSSLLNIKTIVCFISFPHESIYGLKLNEVLPINNDDFFLYPYSLSDISEREEQITGIDYRRNHLSKHNHEILYTNINKFLNGHSNYTEHLIKSGSNDFIYE